MTQFAGSLSLLPPTARRERWRLITWTVAIVVLVVVTVVSTIDLFPTQAELDQVAAVTKDSPTAAAFNGPPIALDTIGGQVAFQLGAFALTVVGLMSILLTSRLTRTEEETGRLELIRSLPVGRHAPVLSAVVVVGAVDVVIGALSAATLWLEDLPLAGSIAMGASFTAVGFLFVGLTTLTAQLTDNARVASGIAGGILAVAYTVRALGDAGSGSLSWLSPIGLAQKSRPYAGEVWWPLLVCVGMGVALLAVAIALANRRDFGSGILPPRPGPANAPSSLRSANGLAIRLQRATVVWWAIGVLGLAVVMGSLTSTIDDFVADNDTLADFLTSTTGASLTDTFLATSLVYVALLAGGVAVQTVLRARAEEADNRAEVLLATPTTRRQFYGSHLGIGLAGSGATLIAGAMGLGVSAAVALHDPGQLSSVTVAGLTYLPAVWLLAALALALLGLAPRLATGAWVAWSGCLTLGMFGQLLDLPGWVLGLSPFDHVAAAPAEDPALLATAVLTAISAGLLVAGAMGLRRRDIGTG